jgi:hypothetical protein
VSPPATLQNADVRGNGRRCLVDLESPGSSFAHQTNEGCLLSASPSSDPQSNCMCGAAKPLRADLNHWTFVAPAGTFQGFVPLDGPSTVFVDPIFPLQGCSPSFGLLYDDLQRLSLVQILRAEFGGRVDGVFLTRKQDDNSWSVLVVVDRHTDDVYDLVIEAEERIVRYLPRTDLSFQVRARKGRPVLDLVPPESCQVPLE